MKTNPREKKINNGLFEAVPNLHSFELKNELNPKLWKNNKLNDKIKSRLIKIAFDYWSELELAPKPDIKDIVITGSLANYNWSKYSDIDLHIIIDFKDVDENIDLVSGFLKGKSKDWNENHKIKMYGFEVEIYVQDINEPHYSTGMYSVTSDNWIKRPSKKLDGIDIKKIEAKIVPIENKIKELEKLYKNKKYSEVIERGDILWDKIKRMRKCGLEIGGELSYENLVFKALRRSGELKKINELVFSSYDKKLTIN